MTNSYVPILILMVLALVVGVSMLLLGWFFGRHQRNPSKLTPYESGVPLLDPARRRINVRFYQIAMLFILFDIEAAFLYPWAVIYRGAIQGVDTIAWFIFFEMLVFVVLLAVGYVYVWKKRTFDWK
jgi:NADH-quinone oxidoreductase subunit A